MSKIRDLFDKAESAERDDRDLLDSAEVAYESRHRGASSTFVESCREFFAERGTLTERQREALAKIADE